MLNLWWLTFKDLGQPKILSLIAIPFFLSLVIMLLLSYALFGWILFSDTVIQSSWMMAIEQWQANAEQSLQSIPLIGGALVWLITMAVVLVVSILGVFLGSYLVLLLAMIITGFMTDKIVKTVRDIHYSEVDYKGHGSTLELTFKIVKYGFFLLILLIITLPLMFIPGINVLLFWLFGYLFFRYAVMLDVGQVVMDASSDSSWLSVWQLQPTGALAGIYSLSLLPFVGLLVPVLAVIAISHYYLEPLSIKQKNV
jgi:CysZ protein